MTPVLSVTAPTAYQVIQRSGTTADIAITGSLLFVTDDIEARFNGGAWATIASSARGVFSGTLTAQAQGQGTLEVRMKNTPSKQVSIANVGIGDVFVIAGQSNASGRGTNSQAYSHATLKAAMFGNNYLWKELVDPTDSKTGQIDTVSSDGTTPTGSIWPLVATSHLENQGVPCAFVPCAMGGTSITAWQPGADHVNRATLYGSMNYRASLTGCKAVLWWQGEQDAFASMDTATYQTNLTALGAAVDTDRGVKVLPAKIQQGNDYNGTQQGNINTAIGNVWNTTGIGTGPDLSDLLTTAGDHFFSDADLATIAGRWWNAIKAQFGW